MYAKIHNCGQSFVQAQNVPFSTTTYPGPTNSAELNRNIKQQQKKRQVTSEKSERFVAYDDVRYNDVRYAMITTGSSIPVG